MGKNTAMINVALEGATETSRWSSASANCCFQIGELFQDPTRVHIVLTVLLIKQSITVLLTVEQKEWAPMQSGEATESLSSGSNTTLVCITDM